MVVGKHPVKVSQTLGKCECDFWTDQTLETVIRDWFPERSANFNLVLSRENNGASCSLGVSP